MGYSQNALKENDFGLILNIPDQHCYGLYKSLISCDYNFLCFCLYDSANYIQNTPLFQFYFGVAIASTTFSIGCNICWSVSTNNLLVPLCATILFFTGVTLLIKINFENSLTKLHSYSFQRHLLRTDRCSLQGLVSRVPNQLVEFRE